MLQLRFGQSLSQVRQSPASIVVPASAVAAMSGRRPSFAAPGKGASRLLQEETSLKHFSCFCSLNHKTQNNSATRGLTAVAVSEFGTVQPQYARPQGEFRKLRGNDKGHFTRHDSDGAVSQSFIRHDGPPKPRRAR